MSGINIDKYNNALSGLLGRINFPTIQNAAQTTVSQVAATLTTTLGYSAGATVGGFQSLTQEIDTDALNAGATNVVGKGMALLTDNPSGVNLKQPIGALNSGYISTLTGLTAGSVEISSGLNVVAVTLPTPEGIGTTLQNISGKNLDELSSAMQSVAPSSTQAIAATSVLKQASDPNGGIFKEFTSSVSKSLSSANQYLNQGFSQPLKDLVEVTNSPLKTIVTSLTQDSGKIVPRSVTLQVNGLVDQGKFLDAAKLLVLYSNKSLADIETVLSTVSTKISDNVDSTPTAFKNSSPRSSAPVTSIGTNDNSWNGASTVVRNPGTGVGFAFTRLAGLEELEAEVRSTTREITEVVISWSEHFINQDVGSEEVHKTSPSGIGYHYIIRKDGTIQRGRPVNIEGVHSSYGHNQYSIAVLIIGGYTCSSGTQNYQSYLSPESINTAQHSALEQLLTVFYRVFPGGQTLGHYQCSDTNRLDPGFDVESYIKQQFNKTNAISYNNNLGSLSRSALISARKTSNVQ